MKYRPLSWKGRYAVVGNVAPSDVVTLTFPIFERTDKVRIEKQEYTLIRKGNDVVHIDPPGKNCPLYQREKYREDKAHTIKVKRFVSRDEVAVNVRAAIADEQSVAHNENPAAAAMAPIDVRKSRSAARLADESTSRSIRICSC